LIDRGLDDYMLETAMLKVWSTEALWQIVNDAFQIHGGAAYFTDNPMERILRDARINQIGEGANEVLTSFIAMAGMKGPGEHLRDVRDAALKPFANLALIRKFATEQAGAWLKTPAVPVRSQALRGHARQLGRLIRRFAFSIQGAMIRHREEILERQLVHERVAKVAMELYASACVLSRHDAELSGQLARDDSHGLGDAAAMLFLHASARRIRENLHALNHNHDPKTLTAARSALGSR
jgi:acyl-CoA dehydrogenase family member 9